MIASATLAGRPFSSHTLDIVSRPWMTEIRAEALTVDAAVGDELIVTLDGAPSIVAHVRTVGQRVGHGYLAAEPLVTQELRLAASRMVGPLVLDDRRPSAIAESLLGGVAVTVQPALDGVLDRWSIREREAAWAWRSLVRAVAVRTGAAVSWRHDARSDTIIVEANRDDWAEATGAPLLRNADWIVLEAAPIQAGDLWQGLPVIYARTRLDQDTHRTRIRTEAA